MSKLFLQTTVLYGMKKKKVPAYKLLCSIWNFENNTAKGGKKKSQQATSRQATGNKQQAGKPRGNVRCLFLSPFNPVHQRATDR
jgi:hypothetical protein